MYSRIFIDILLGLGVFFLPPWLVFLIALVGIFYFDSFYEILCAGICLDVLYGQPLPFLSIPLLYTFFAAVLFWGSMLLKTHLKFYDR